MLNQSVEAITTWCDRWGMNVNPDKTMFMRITNKKQPFIYPYNIKGTPILLTESYKYLGVTITSKLTWSSHIEKICSSARRKLGMLRHKLKSSPPSTKLLAYNTIVRSGLEYACEVWDPHTKKDINNLEKIQRLAVRFIFNRFRQSDSPTELMNDNKIQTLECRRKTARLKFLFYLSTKKSVLDLSNILSPLSSRPTRRYHSQNFTPIFARTNNFKYSFFPRTITDWNELPHHIFESGNVLRCIENVCEVI